MERLEQMMENKHNFKNYRDRLAKIKLNGEPTLPYLGVYLRDLTFIEEGNKTYITEHRLINYEKIQLVGQVIRFVLPSLLLLLLRPCATHCTNPIPVCGCSLLLNFLRV
jgi:hypothetical protein